MGVRLIVEVLDHWQDADLTPGERWDLLVLAENANDGSRLTFGPVHAPHILQRANKSPKGWKNAITALMRKKVITTHVPGRINQCAVYHLEHLCPEPPHSGYKGHCTKPVATPDGGAAGVTPPLAGVTPAQEEGHLSDDPVSEEGHPVDDPMGHPTDDPLGQEGHPVDAERVIQQMTPTPLVSSFKDSPLSTPSSSVAEDSEDGSVAASDGTEGGGGGESFSSEDQEQDKPLARAESFVDSLDYRGKRLGQTRRAKLTIRVAVAFKDGWTEKGLRRYLDISDDPTVRDPAAVYAHRLKDDELPDATADPTLPPACWDCLGHDPAAATDLALRINPITCDPCPNCHPATVGQSPEVPPACQPCLEENPAARTNVRMRYRIIDDVHQACPDCHPKRIVILAAQNGQQQETDAWTDRAMARARQRMETGDWRGAGTDERAAGWMALAQSLGDKPSITDQRVQRAVEAGKRVQRQQGPRLGRNYSNDVWQQPADPAKAAKIPHCGDPNCDPVTRLKTEPDWTGEPHTAICGHCHPAVKF